MGSVSATRTTETNKIRFSFSSNYNENLYKYDAQEVLNVSRSQGFYSSAVFGISDHLSAGLSGDIFSSTYSNISIAFRLSPVLEYNIFPYHQSTRREFRLNYSIGSSYARYIEETIYNKTKEQLYHHKFSANIELKEEWGSIGMEASASQYFHDFRKHRIDLGGNVSLRLIAGLSLRIDGKVARTRDQLSIPRRGATEQEVLLRRRILESHYWYYTSIGLSYTIGSIYSNIVNPRLGD